MARRYFERLGVKPSAVPKAARTVEIKSELGRQLGFELPVEVNSVSLDRRGLSYRAWPNIPKFKQDFLRANRQGADVGYFENDAAKSNETALVLSNSFGVGIRGYLSLGYKSLFHVNVSQLRPEELKTDAFFAFLMKTLKPDQVIVVSHDGGADGIIGRVASAVGGR